EEGGGVGQELGNVEARDVALDRLQLAANLDRRRRLGVEGFELAGRAIQEEEDTRFGAAEMPIVGSCPCVGGEAHRVGESEAERAKSANLQQDAAYASYAQLTRCSA